MKKLYYIGIFFVVFSFCTALLFGGAEIDFAELKDSLINGINSTVSGRILFYSRFPRVICSLLCGASLALSGAVIQCVLSNSLASPGIIGVNSGAGLAVTICAAVGIYGGLKLSFFSFLGAFAAVMIVNIGARKWGASRSTVILIGVAMNSLLNALSDIITTLDPDIRIVTGDFKIGEFSAVTYDTLVPALVIVLTATAFLITIREALGVITLGEESARSLGMNTVVMRIVFLSLAALLAGCAVSLAGLLPFIGLIVPHIIRRISGNNIRHLVPLCVLYGAGFVCVCDTLARTLFYPYEIPVGIIMSLIGAPFFVFMLIKGKRGDSDA